MNTIVQKEIMEMKCFNGDIKVYENKIIISRNNFLSYLSQNGFSGERAYFYTDIISVEYKPPKYFIDGFLKFVISGSNDTYTKTGFLLPSQNTFNDRNTLILSIFEPDVVEKSRKIYDYIVSKIENKHRR